MRTLAVSLILSLSFLSHSMAAEPAVPPLAPSAVLGSNNEVFLEGPHGRAVARNAKNGRLIWTSKVTGKPVGVADDEVVLLSPAGTKGEARLVTLSTRDGSELRSSKDFTLGEPAAGERLVAFARRNGDSLFLTHELQGKRGEVSFEWPSLKVGEQKSEKLQGRSFWEAPPVSDATREKLGLKASDVAEVTREGDHVVVFEGEGKKATLTLHAIDSGRKVATMKAPRGQVAVLGGRVWLSFLDQKSKRATPTVEVRNLPSGKRIWSHRAKAILTPRAKSAR